MQDYSIEQVDQPDLVFTGDVIGQSTGQTPMLRIFRTKGGKFIAAILSDRTRSQTATFDKPGDLVAWLERTITMTAELQLAIENAAKNDDTFKAFWTQRVA